MGTPATLPANFFDQGTAKAQPQTLPADFFDREAKAQEQPQAKAQATAPPSYDENFAQSVKNAPTEYQGAFTPYQPQRETMIEKLALGTPNEPTTFGQRVFESIPREHEQFNRAGQPLYHVSELGPSAGPTPGEVVRLDKPLPMRPGAQVTLPQTPPEEQINQTRATALPMIRPSAVIDKQAHPFAYGATEAAESMTSPESMGMLASSGLFGALPEAAQAVIPRLVSAGFTAQMVKTAWDQNKAFQDALKRGDTNAAYQILGQFAVNATLGTLAGRHAIEGETPMPLGTLDREKAAAPELMVNGELARDRLARRMNDVRANQAARQGLGELERRIEAGQQERINAPVTLPKLGEEPPTLLNVKPRPQPTLAEQAAEAREQLADEGRLEPQGLRVVDRRTLAPELREPVASPIRSPEGALYGQPPAVANHPALPALTGAPEEVDFLAGRPTPTPRFQAIPTLGVIEDVAARKPSGLPPQLGTPLGQTGRMETAPQAPVSLGEPAAALGQPARAIEGMAERLRREGKLPAAQPAESPLAVRPQLGVPVEAKSQAGVLSERTGPQEPTTVEKVKPEPYAKQQAQLYINRIRNLYKREYAQSYLKARLQGGEAPERGELGYWAARGVRDNLDEYLGKQKPQPVRGEFPPDVLADAEAQMRGAHELLTSMPAAGRYRTGPASGLREDESKFDEWYGVKSGRNIAAGMYPWYADETIATPGQLAKAVEKGKGADYERIVRHIAQGMMEERESAAPVVAEYAPQLRELAEATRATDPDLSQTLTNLADGKLTLAAPKLRAYIQEKISDAETKANAATALDAAESEAGEQAGLAEPAGTGNQAGPEQGPHSVAEGVLPGMQPALEAERQAAEEHQGRELTEQFNRPPGSIESAAGEMETRSPLFRGTAASPQSEMFAGKPRPGELARENEGEAEPTFNPEEFGPISAEDLDRLMRDESGTVSPGMLADVLSGRLGKEAWQRFVASPLIRGLGLGDKYEAVKQADPEIAERLHLLDNAASYYRQKAQTAVRNIVGNLSREQERLFVLMADADSRDNLRQNHPAEFQAAMRDPAIQEALRKYRPIERELTESRERMGGATLPGDYLRRVYEQYVSGIGKEQAPGERPQATAPFDRIVPQRVPGQSRTASAEDYYQRGLHELGPSLGTKYIATHVAELRNSIARDFMDKATEIQAGATMPRSISYEGKTYYRPDIAAELGHDAEAYGVYDQSAGTKFPAKSDLDKRYIGPASIVDALHDYGDRREGPGGWMSGVNRFLQEQVIGFGLGLPHVANILRRTMQAEPGAQLNPRAWADAWRVLFDKELRARGINGLNDPTFDKLAKHGAITPGEMRELKKYWGGNISPANWARSLAQVGHRLLFEPGTFGGFGGIDQRARIWVADLVKSQHPEYSDAEVAQAVETQLGQYNRQNWTETQKRVAPFMLFPGWSLSSMRWVIEHPVKTTVPAALLVLAANQAIHQLGGNTDRDAWDIQNIHVGDRSIGITLLRESMARNIERPLLNYAGSKLLGETGNRPTRAAAQGLVSGAAGLAGTLNPILTGGIALATKRQDVFNHRDLWQPGDWEKPGVVMPNKALDNIAALAVRHAIPSLDRILQPGEPLDFASFAGGNVGLPNYRQGPEDRLKRNAAQSADAYSTLQGLAKTSPERARAYVQDPENAALLLFHSDLEHMASTLKRMDEAEAAIKEAKGLGAQEKASRLKNIEDAKINLLRQADGLDHLLFERERDRRAQQAKPLTKFRPLKPLSPTATVMR